MTPALPYPGQKFVVFHPGTQHSWQTAVALQQLGRLQFYATSIYYMADKFPYSMRRYAPARVAAKIEEEFGRFQHPHLDASLVRTAGIYEVLERLTRRAGYRGLANWIDAVGNKNFANHLRQSFRSPENFGLWGYSGSSHETFRQADKRFRILDRTIGDWRAYNRTIQAVHAEYPEFFLPGEYLAAQKTIDLDDVEYGLSDVILTGSEFCAGTVREFGGDKAAGKVQVLNYCYDEAIYRDAPEPVPSKRSEPVKFLFLGQAVPRKGFHLLLKAFQRIPASAATLTIVGSLGIPDEVMSRYADRVVLHGNVARSKVAAFIQASDCLVFPSYFEGSALSILEALACGLGVIQTKNSGDGATEATGIVLEEPTEQGLYEALMIAIEDRDRLNGWKASAKESAKRYTFEAYRGRIASLLDSIDNAVPAAKI